MKSFEEQFEILKAGVLEITPEDEFKKMLKHSIENNKPLRVKCGIDPTNTDVHLGHLVPYRKMRAFQDLGHTGVVIIGDYTAQIGDPTGKNESRPALTSEQVASNAKTYMEQVFTVLDPEKTEIRYQSEWFGDKSLLEILGWAAQTTVAKLLSHDTFRNRLEGGNSLGLHELFYPVLQGVDSLMIKADVELGGSEQKFNVLMGRDYQRHANSRPQVAMLLPLVMGLDGKEKMSKSLNNYIGVKDEAFDMFGKVMSAPDELMPDYYEYLLSLSPAELKQTKEEIKDGTIHPNEAKKQLASKVVSFFHGEAAGSQMREQFEAVFKKGGIPEDTPEFEIKSDIGLLDLLVDSKLFATKSEVRRMVKQNATGFMDGEKITSENFIITSSHKGEVIKVGKRKFLKLV